MGDSKDAGPREVTYPTWLPTYETKLGKIVRTSDVAGYSLDVISGNPRDEGTDWALLGSWINGAAEFAVGVFKMTANQTHPPHYHPVGPEFYYIVEGSCIVQVDDEMVEARPETAIYLPEGTVHAVWTREDEAVTILYGFAERPDAQISTVWLE
jgi:putative monooxygenase